MAKEDELPTYGTLQVFTRVSVDIEVNMEDLYVDRDWLTCPECAASFILMDERPAKTTVRRCPACGVTAKYI